MTHFRDVNAANVILKFATAGNAGTDARGLGKNLSDHVSGTKVEARTEPEKFDEAVRLERGGVIERRGFQIELSIEDALQRNNHRELALDHLRYIVLRRLKPRQFAYLNKLNLEGRNFDGMVDDIAAGTFDWSGMAEQENKLCNL